jgi:hypothetical protein
VQEGLILDWLTFISSIVRNLAWPVVVLSVLGAFLIKGRHFVGLVKSIKFKDFELTIRNEFVEARAGAEQIKLQLDAQPELELLPQDKILKLAEIDSALAIVDIWKKLEAEVIGLIQHNGQMRYTTSEKFILALVDLGKLTMSEANLYRNLRQIRNASVHSHSASKLTLAEVIEFRDFSNMLANKLKLIKSEPGYIDLPQS